MFVVADRDEVEGIRMTGFSRNGIFEEGWKKKGRKKCNNGGVDGEAEVVSNKREE